MTYDIAIVGGGIVGLATGNRIQALMQNNGEDIPYREGTEVSVHLPATALRVLTDTGVRLASEGD